MRTRVLFAFLLTAAALFIGFQPAAEAAGSGTAAVSCTAVFPHVPWTNVANPNPGGTCNGSAGITGSGVDDGLVPFAISGVGAFASAFSYYEPCPVNGAPAIFLSFANGTFAVAGLTAVHGANVTTATVTGLFSWNRIGLNPVITLANVVVAFGDGGTSSLPGVGVGTASFVPPGTFNPNTQLLCGQAGGPLTIPVAIAAEVAL